jgi:hypothetical protein
MNYKHAPYIFVISVIGSSRLATTAALSNGPMKSPGGASSGAMPGRGLGSPGEVYINSPSVPTNPSLDQHQRSARLQAAPSHTALMAR